MGVLLPWPHVPATSTRHEVSLSICMEPSNDSSMSKPAYMTAISNDATRRRAVPDNCERDADLSMGTGSGSSAMDGKIRLTRVLGTTWYPLGPHLNGQVCARTLWMRFVYATPSSVNGFSHLWILTGPLEHPPSWQLAHYMRIVISGSMWSLPSPLPAVFNCASATRHSVLLSFHLPTGQDSTGLSCMLLI
jgi:hypothetical protein